MSINKDAFLRYKILDNCFRNPGKRYCIDDLVEICSRTLIERNPNSRGISRRQIYNDILFMESSEGWQIDLLKTRDGNKVFYRYSDLSFSINNLPLNEVELNNLKTAAEILSHFSGMPQFIGFEEILTKINHQISFPNQEQVISFDNNPYLKGLENLPKIHNAIIYKKVLRIEYKPYNEDKISVIQFHPYFLKQYNNRWFVYGLNTTKNKEDWNLAIDRIDNCYDSSDTFKPNRNINWSEYFDDFIGVTKPENSPLEEVILHFKGIAGHYILTKPIHGSQKAKWLDRETLEVKLLLQINYELESLILSFAGSIKIISPSNLTEKILSLQKASIQLNKE